MMRLEKLTVAFYFDSGKNGEKIKAAKKLIEDVSYDSYWFIDEEEA